MKLSYIDFKTFDCCFIHFIDHEISLKTTNLIYHVKKNPIKKYFDNLCSFLYIQFWCLMKFQERK